MELIGELPPAHVWDALGFPAELNAYLDWLEAQGVRELLWTPEPSGLEAVSAALSGRRLTLTVILPNMSLYARDAMDSGPTGAVLKRFRALSLPRLARLGLRLLPRTSALLEKRFSAGAILLAEAEYLRLSGLPVAKVVLHNSVVDMALAFGCREMIEEFGGWAQRRGKPALFMTNNLGLWSQRMAEWNFSGLVALTPVNEKGYLMQPDRASVEAHCKANVGLVYATDTGGVAYPASLGLTHAVIAWGGYRPTSIKDRLAAWKKRAEGAGRLR